MCNCESIPLHSSHLPIISLSAGLNCLSLVLLSPCQVWSYRILLIIVFTTYDLVFIFHSLLAKYMFTLVQSLPLPRAALCFERLSIYAWCSLFSHTVTACTHHGTGFISGAYIFHTMLTVVGLPGSVFPGILVLRSCLR